MVTDLVTVFLQGLSRSTIPPLSCWAHWIRDLAASAEFRAELLELQQQLFGH